MGSCRRYDFWHSAARGLSGCVLQSSKLRAEGEKSVPMDEQAARAALTDTLARLGAVGARIWRSEQRIHHRLPPGAVIPVGVAQAFQNSLPTLLQAASLTQRENVCLVPLSVPKVADASVVCVHLLHGTVYDYRHMSAQICGNYAVYGMQVIGMLLAEKVPTSVAQMADWYMDELLQNELCSRPLVLYGGCTGGFIALEMARRLSDLGMPPAALILAETRDRVDLPRSLKMSGTWTGFVEAFLPFEVAHSFRVNPDHKFWKLKPWQRFRYLVDVGGTTPGAMHSVPLQADALAGYFTVYESYLRAYGSHCMSDYAGRSVYLKASNARWSLSSRTRECLKGTCQLEMAEGDHAGLFRAPRGCEVAALVQRELAAAAGEWAKSGAH